MKPPPRSRPRPAPAVEPVPTRTVAPDISPRAALVLGVLFALALYALSIPNWATHFPGSERTDMNRAYRHFLAFAFGSLREGTVPLWNPFIFCGSPFLPNTGATVLQPLNALLFLALPLPLSVNIVVAIHSVILALGAAWYARVRGCGGSAMLLAAMAASGGALLPTRAYAGHFTIVCTAAWIPAVFCAQELVFRRGMRFTPLLGLLSGMMFLGGHLQYAYYAALLMGLHWVAFGFLSVDSPRLPWFRRQAAAQAVAGLVAFGLGAAEILTVLDGLGGSARRAVTETWWPRFFAFPPENLLTLVAPGAFGSGHEYFGRWYWWEVCYYVGIAGFAFSVLHVARGARQRRPDPLAVVSAVAVMLAIGGYVPGLSTVMSWVPGWSTFRGHAKIGGFALALLPVMGALGFQWIRDGGSRRGLVAGAAAFGAAGLVALVAHLAMTRGFWERWILSPGMAAERMGFTNPVESAVPELAGRALAASQSSLMLAVALSVGGAALLVLRTRMAAGIWSVAFLLLTGADLAVFAVPVLAENFRPRPSRTSLPAGAQDWLRPQAADARLEIPVGGRVNEGMTDGIPAFGGNDVNVTRYYDTLCNAYFGSDSGHPHLDVAPSHDHPLLDAANVRYLALPSPQAPGDPGQMENAGTYDEWTLWRRRSCLPRAYVVGKARWTGDSEKQILDGLMLLQNVRREVLLVGNSPAGTAPEESFDAVSAPVKYDGLYRASIRAPRGGWLVLADGYSPRWTATVNGNKAVVLRANSAFRAVRVSAGDEVVFVYRNPAFVTGAAITMLTWIGLIGFGCALLFRRQSASSTRSA